MPEEPNVKLREPPAPPTSVAHCDLPYAELDVTSNFSFLRGSSHPDELVYQAATLGYRALAITDHPDLADAIRTIEARVYCVARADAKLAQGLSKSEARRQEVLSKKLSALKEKRAELDTQISALEAESQELGAARLTDFQRERHEALQSLMVALATHDPALDAAGLNVRSLLPELSGLMPELEAIARTATEQRAAE